MVATKYAKTYGIFDTFRNKPLIKELEETAEKVFILPRVEANKMLNHESESIIKNVKDFDWIIFTDVFTVDFFLEALIENNVDVFELDDISVCACGDSVADRIRFAQIHVDLIPEDLSARSILEALKLYVACDSHLLRILVTCDDGKSNGLAALFEKENWEVVEVSMYYLTSVPKLELAKLRSFLLGGAIDEFIFGAAEDVVGFRKFFGEEEYLKILEDVKPVAADSTTFQTLREIGLQPVLYT